MSHRYLEILDFTQFFDHFVFTPNAENVLEKELKREIPVSVGIELVSLCWSYRNYGDKADCEKDYDVESTIKYDDWEHRVFERILTARPPRNGLYVLPFAIKEMMEW